MEAFVVYKVWRNPYRVKEMFKLVAPSYDDALQYLQTRDDCNYIPEPNAEMILLLRDEPEGMFKASIIVLIDDGDEPFEITSYSYHEEGTRREVTARAIALAEKHMQQQVSRGLVVGARAEVEEV